MDWFIIKENDHQGPFEESHLIEMNEKGEIPGDTLIWKEGLDKPGTLNDLVLEAPPELPPEKPVYNPYKVLNKIKKEEAPLPPPPRPNAPRELRKEDFIEEEIEERPRKKRSKRGPVLFVLFLLVILGVLVGMFFYSKTLENNFTRPAGMGTSDYSRLLEVAKDQGGEVKFAWAMARDKSKLWMAVNVPYEGAVNIKVTSAPEMILADEEIQASAKGQLQKGLVEFNEFQFNSGQRIVEGRYLIEVKSSELQAPLLYKLLGKKNFEFSHQDVALLSLLGPERFAEALRKFKKKAQNNASLFWEELEQKYLTVRAITKSIRDSALEVFEGEGEWQDKVKQFEQNYTQNYGSFFTSFVIQNEKSYEELEQKDFPDKVSVISYYTRLSRMAKRFGGETMNALDEMQKLSNKTPEEREAAKETIMEGFNDMNGTIDEALQEIENEQNAI